MTTNMDNSSQTPSKHLPKITSKVRVILRVRPFLDHELASIPEHPLSCVSLLSNGSDPSAHDVVSVCLKDQHSSRSECYKVDGYFEEEDDNVRKIYEKEVKELIAKLFEGCNSTVFAYGATGSGKTFTMQGTNEQQGLMQLALSEVLSICEASGSIAEISYFEVYLDRCYDLLEIKAKEISVLDDKEGQIHLRGMSRVPINSMCEFYEVFSRGIQRRKVAHTGLNDVSSRSHGVLAITVTSPDNGGEGSITGKLNLIDLAGNEDNNKSGNEGIRLQESAKINQSLFALSNVIYALNNNKPRIPYRESKLTRILQDSLGGTSRALMVACLNPGNYQEAVHTVSLAARSRHISNVVPSALKPETPKVKIDMEAKLRAWLESKGKTNSTQSKQAFGSPFFLKTPGHGSSVKKQSVQRSSVKAKTTNLGTSNLTDRFVPQRKLFDGEAKLDSRGVWLEELKRLDDCPTTNEAEDDILSSQLAAPNFVNSRHFITEVKVPVSCDTDEESIMDGTTFKSTLSLPDELLEDDEKANNIARDDIIQSPINRPKIISCHSPLRKALSPISSNISRMPMSEVSFRDNVLSVLCQPGTPNTPFGVPGEIQNSETPLHKFHARSSNLKSCLAQEYIDFLNSATREELVALKGIGVKRAEYIIELRETSPLKSLNDLEKIGLSSKQVQHMFGRAAKGIFG